MREYIEGEIETRQIEVLGRTYTVYASGCAKKGACMAPLQHGSTKFPGLLIWHDGYWAHPNGQPFLFNKRLVNAIERQYQDMIGDSQPSG